MKKTLILIISLISMSIILFVVFIKANHIELTEKEALEIGEEKYLKFLWIVDGAFNNQRLDSEFRVNDKVLNDNDKKFTCTYNKKDNSCIGNNFEEEFKNLFSENITFDKVYGDESFYTWIKYEKGKYIFTNLNNCSINRMNLNQSIKLESMNSNELVFNVTSMSENNKIRTKQFVLTKEDDDWKISKAYYHDVCEMDYYIE